GIELGIGYDYPTTLTPGFGSFPYQEKFKMWLDLNQDGEFTEDEALLQSSAPSTSALTGTISIPQNALEGATRMRITMKYADNNASDPVACGPFEFGEIEDYCVTIVNTTGIEESTPLSAFEIFPNPSKKSFHLNFEPLGENSSSGYLIKIIDLTGKTVYQSSVSKGENRLTHQLNAGMYMVQLQNAQGELLKSEKLVVIE